MPTTYREASPDVGTLVKKLRSRYPDLIEADVSIKLLFARGEEAPAIMHHGWPALALIRINNLRDRVAGLADLTLLIDEEQWEELTVEGQEALIDHELYHVELRRNKVGSIRYDDANRPKVRLKPHDFQISGFHAMVRTHGIHAHEAQSVRQILKVWKQGCFAWAEESELANA